jgi:excisionase family DNA binding protein
VDGYTVEEAASVLGVPRERVWELLARGIITGTTDLGGAMRVRLKAESAPMPAPAPAHVERPVEAAYGAATEVTPFRELLTEFRSLTERYGQALLALGEARGEVAGLRSRVDMLEARVDLRLPSSTGPISSSWSSTPWPVPAERVVQPPATAPAESPAVEDPTAAERSDADAPHGDDAGSHRRRGRAGRRATERFADALARAEDPSLPELPGAEETAAAIAALRQELSPEAQAAEPDTADRDAESSLPRELPSAERVPVADEDEDQAEAIAAPGVERAGDTGRDEDLVRAAVEPVEHEEAPSAEAVVPEPEPTPVAATVEERITQVPEPDSGAGWDHERYSAAIEEPGWISADDGEPATAWGSPPDPASAAPASAPSEPEPSAAWSAREEEMIDEVPVHEPADEDPARTGPTAEGTRETSTAIPIESSGSRELDEGLAALDALANPQPARTEGVDDWASGLEREAQPIGAPRPQAWVRPSPPPQLVTRSSASRAYRRLRRIFPT